MSMLRIFNRQRTRPLDGRRLVRAGRCLLEELLGRPDYELAVHLITASEMARLNEDYLQHEGSTDVITFNHLDAPDGRKLYGEIFISVDDALSQARQFRTTWQAEVARYLVHGILHLEGCDDLEPAARRRMKRRENMLLKKLSARLDLRKLQRNGRPGK